MTVYIQEDLLGIQEELWDLLKEIRKELKELRFNAEKALDFSFSTWYNGREHGFLIEAKHNYSLSRYIMFSNNRNSDTFVFETWEFDGYLTNPMTLEMRTEVLGDKSEEIYKNREHFGEIEPLKNRIFREINASIEREEAKRILKT